MSHLRPNKPPAPNRRPRFPLGSTARFGYPFCAPPAFPAAVGEAQRSPIMRAERAKLKSCKDDEIIAQGKRSAALGYGRKMIPSFSPSGFARLGRAKPEGEKEVGWGGSLPRAAASAALPWAIIFLPLRGAVTGLASGGFLAPFALVFVPALQGATGAVVLAILVAGALGAIVGVSVAIMKNDSEL
jgi:hypothetical protein